MIQAVLLWLLSGYKWLISPLFPVACRYVPTCSEYAMEAVATYGSVRGGAMACWRLLRCHPFARGGYDPLVSAGVTVRCAPPACCNGHIQSAGAKFARQASDSKISDTNLRHSWRC